MINKNKSTSGTISSTSATITVRYTTSADLPGFLYCIALKEGTVPTTISSLIRAKSVVAYLPASTSSTMQITQLTALTTYNLFCVLQATDGTTTSLSEAQKQVTSFTTSCCKSLAFLSGPSYVINDATVYLTGSISSTSFVVQATAIPIATVTIQPVMYFATTKKSVASTNYYLVPSSVTLRSTSTSLQTSFVLLITNTSILANCYLGLSTSGASAAEYYLNVSRTFSVVANLQSSFPAPALSSALFADSGVSLYISFDSATNRAGATSSSGFTCSSLFNFTGAYTSSCSWINSTTVYIQSLVAARNGIQLSVGDTVSVYASKVTIACTSSQFKSCANLSNNTAASVSIQAPFNGIVPRPVVSVSSVINQCQSFTINPTGSSGAAGRAWSSVKWNVTTTSTSLTSYATLLQSLLTSGSSTGGSIVSMPANILLPGTYYVSLTLTNFLGSSATSTQAFQYSASSTTTSVTILGSAYVSVNAYSPLSLSSTASVVTCGASTAATYIFTWQAYQDGVLQSFQSSSNSPRLYTLPAYTFSSGLLYVMRLTVNAVSTSTGVTSSASAVAYVRVLSGSIIAQIAGASIRKISEDVSLDASSSYDQDSSSSSSSLLFSWSCLVSSLDSYGQGCESIFSSRAVTNTSSILVLVSSMNVSTMYAVSVMVTATDNRFATADVTLSKLISSSSVRRASAAISTESVIVSTESYVTLTGRVQADAATSLLWAATEDSNEVSISSALTPTSLNVTSALAQAGVSFPFKIFASSFTPGASVTFSLSVFSSGSNSNSATLLAYNAVTLSMVGPPQNGIVTASPEVGVAFSTSFLFVTSGWVSSTDSISNLPLTFDFRYRKGGVSSTASAVFIQAASYAATVESDLPEGLETDGRQMQIIVRAYDSLGAFSTVVTIVNVTATGNSSANEALSAYLASVVSTALSSYNNDQALSAVNNVAITLGQVNCTGATDAICLAFNRASCSSVAFTCGSCLTGYTGLIGAANSQCSSNADSTYLGGIGSTCSIDSDCLYQYCDSSNICSASFQSCPTSVANTTCSGHGSCNFLVNSRSVEQSACTIKDTGCVPTCSCITGYLGKTCSFAEEDLELTNELYDTLCSTLVSVSASSDASLTTLESLASSLLATSSSMNGLNVSEVCIEALQIIMELSAGGYLSQNSDAVNNLVQTLSNYVVQGDSNYIDNGASNLVNGIMTQMVDGEQAQTFTSDNLRLQVRRDLITELANATLEAPKSDAEEAFNVTVPSIQLSGDSYTNFNSGNGYMRLSLGVWASNPFANVSSTLSSVLRIQNYPNVTASDSGAVDSNKNSSYFEIALPFLAVQQFLNTTDEEKIAFLSNNFTLPACNIISNDVSSECGGCELISYDETQAIFRCYDVSLLTGPASSTSDRRRGRRLFTLSGDDDGGSLSTPDVNIQEISALLKLTSQEIVLVLSLNPLNIDINEAKPVLAMVGTLAFIIIYGLIYFSEWDRMNYYEMVYASKDAFRSANFSTFCSAN